MWYGHCRGKVFIGSDSAIHTIIRYQLVVVLLRLTIGITVLV